MTPKTDPDTIEVGDIMVDPFDKGEYILYLILRIIPYARSGHYEDGWEVKPVYSTLRFDTETKLVFRGSLAAVEWRKLC
jgi:hypothetical protein